MKSSLLNDEVMLSAVLNATPQIVHMSPEGCSIETCTGQIRRVTRVGGEALQQLWRWQSADGMNGGSEWRDVPLVQEEVQ